MKRKFVSCLIFIYIAACDLTSADNEGTQSQRNSSRIKQSTAHAKAGELRLQLVNADSIFLITHAKTYGPIFNKTGPEHTKAKKLVEGGVINRYLINKTVLIDGEEKDRLINILTQPIKGDPVDVAACFDPRHALIIVSKSQYCFLEFCFACGGVDSDKLEISTADFDKEKWKMVYEYIDNKIPIKE